MTDDDTDQPGDSSDVVPSLLSDARPAPAPGFRSALARRLAEEDPSWGPRPQRLWPLSLIPVLIGAALLLLGAFLSVGSI